MKKIVALILAVALMLGAMPFAFAGNITHPNDIGACCCFPDAPSLAYYHLAGGGVKIYCLDCRDIIHTDA